MDKATTTFQKLAFARCFIEIFATKPLPKTVSLEMDGGEKVSIEVEFEWLPPTCTKCKCFGHDESQCPAIEVWRQKVSSPKDKANPNDENKQGNEDVQGNVQKHDDLGKQMKNQSLCILEQFAKGDVHCNRLMNEQDQIVQEQLGVGVKVQNKSDQIAQEQVVQVNEQSKQGQVEQVHIQPVQDVCSMQPEQMNINSSVQKDIQSDTSC